MKQATKPFSVLTQKILQKYGNKKKITLITNKTSYAHGSLCQDCGMIAQCTQCDVAIGYHKDAHGGYFGICHYCKTTFAPPSQCSSCQGHSLTLYGIGAQQVAELLLQQYNLPATILDASKLGSIPKILTYHERPDTVIATNILIQPHKSCDILILLNADQGLQLPDYQARRNNFCHLSDAIAKHPGQHIIIQTYHAEDWIVHCAALQDIQQARNTELSQRALMEYPPYKELCLFSYKDEVEAKLFTTVHTLYQELLYLKQKSARDDITIVSTPPLIYKLHGKFRYTVLCSGKNLREFISEAYQLLSIKKRGFMVDWMPTQTV